MPHAHAPETRPTCAAPCWTRTNVCDPQGPGGGGTMQRDVSFAFSALLLLPIDFSSLSHPSVGVETMGLDGRPENSQVCIDADFEAERPWALDTGKTRTTALLSRVAGRRGRPQGPHASVASPLVPLVPLARRSGACWWWRRAAAPRGRALAKARRPASLPF